MAGVVESEGDGVGCDLAHYVFMIIVRVRHAEHSRIRWDKARDGRNGHSHAAVAHEHANLVILLFIHVTIVTLVTTALASEKTRQNMGEMSSRADESHLSGMWIIPSTLCASQNIGLHVPVAVAKPKHGSALQLGS